MLTKSPQREKIRKRKNYNHQIRKKYLNKFKSKKSQENIIVLVNLKYKNNLYFYPQECNLMSLYKYISIYGPVNEQQAHYMFTQVLTLITNCNSINIGIKLLTRTGIVINPYTLEIKMLIPKICTTLLPQTIMYSSYYAPPEIITKNKYFNNSLSTWNLGILLYYMLHAKMPFANKWDIVYSPHVLSCSRFFSFTLQSLLNWCLNKTAYKRITLQECLYHPWVTQKYI